MAWAKKLNPDIAKMRRKRFRQLLFNRFHVERGLRILPNIFTLGNAFFGFGSIVATAYGEFVTAAYFILLGALMDMLDGRIARYTKMTSDLGVQLDSLSDSISFCLAPALLVYFWRLRFIGDVGLLVSAFFLLCGVVRLARFNITHGQQGVFFKGMPTTIAGCFLATLVINGKVAGIVSHGFLFVLVFVTLLLAVLMVSAVPFPTFKKLSPNSYALFLTGLLAALIAFGLTKVLFILFMLYFLLVLVALVKNKLSKS